MRGVAVGEKKVGRPGGGALPEEHAPARYAYARVCRRCGQDWPCTFELGLPIRDRYSNEEEEAAVAAAVLTAPQAIRAAWAQDALQGIRW